MTGLNELGRIRKMQPYPEVSRIEVIDGGGRAYTQWGVEAVEVHLQDDGRTMKIFLRKKDE